MTALLKAKTERNILMALYIDYFSEVQLDPSYTIQYIVHICIKSIISVFTMSKFYVRVYHVIPSHSHMIRKQIVMLYCVKKQYFFLSHFDKMLKFFS